MAGRSGSTKIQTLGGRRRKARFRMPESAVMARWKKGAAHRESRETGVATGSLHLRLTR
jgi:hypothetical protein